MALQLTRLTPKSMELSGQHNQQSNRYFVRFDMDGDFEILAKIGPWVAAGAFDLSGTVRT